MSFIDGFIHRRIYWVFIFNELPNILQLPPNTQHNRSLTPVLIKNDFLVQILGEIKLHLFVCALV